MFISSFKIRERAQTLLEIDLDVIVHGCKAKTEETRLRESRIQYCMKFSII